MEVDPRKVNLAEADIEQYLWENPHLVQLQRLCTPTLIGRSVTDSLYRDCEACGVHVQVFDVSFKLRVRSMGWGQGFYEEREQQHIELGDDKDIAEYVATVKEQQRNLEEALQALSMNSASSHANGDGI